MLVDTILNLRDSIPEVIAKVAGDSTIENMKALVQATADNTTFGFIPEGLDLLIAGVALGFSFFTFWSQWKTERNTSLLSKKEQKQLLYDMTRHLYRNYVVSYSMREKMKNIKFGGYPSEEHLKKLKVMLSDIHLNLFYKNNDHHRLMNKLYMELRNYNEEIDVICAHFKDPKMSEEVKRRDLATLLFKCNHLTKRIISNLSIIWYGKPISDDETTQEYAPEVLEGVRNVIITEQNEKNSMEGTDYDLPVTPMEGNEGYKGAFYLKTLFCDETLQRQFVDRFNRNIVKECGLNRTKSQKIYIISFPSEEKENAKSTEE